MTMTTFWRHLLNSSIGLLYTFSLIASSPVFSADQCNAVNATAQDVEACLKANDAKQPDLPQLKFPAGFASSEMTPVQLYVNDDRKWVDVLVQSDGESLNFYQLNICRGFAICIVGKPRLLASIPKARIYSYSQGIQGTGNTAAYAMTGVATAAFIMPILAPFQAMATSKNTKIFEYAVTEIAEDGQIKTLQFTATSLIPVNRVFEDLLPALTGMKPGEFRTKEQIANVVQAGISVLEKKITDDRSLLVIANPKKPWCEESLASKFPLIYVRYQSNIKSLNLLRKLIDMPPLQDSIMTADGQTSSDKWKTYLSANQGMAAWAKANPLPAQKLRKCSP